MAFSRVALFDSESIGLLRPTFRHGAKLVFSVQAGAAVPDKQPNNTAATIPTPKHAPVGGVPAFPSPSAKGTVSSGKATPANASIPGKGAFSAAQAFPAEPPAAASSQVIHIVLQLLFCNILLHAGDCTADTVRYLMCSTNVLDMVEGWLHHIPIATHICPNPDTCLRHISQ